MNKIKEIILTELNSGEKAEFHGKDYSQFSISDQYSEKTIKRHLRELEKEGKIKKSFCWNKRTATYYKVDLVDNDDDKIIQ